jgi:hypothetical protein
MAATRYIRILNMADTARSLNSKMAEYLNFKYGGQRAKFKFKHGGNF